MARQKKTQKTESVTEEASARTRSVSYIFGIDPGLSGAVAVVSSDGKLLAAHPMPSQTKLVSRSRRRYYDTAAFSALIKSLKDEHKIVCAAVERVGASPQMGTSSAFSFGHGYGIIHGVLEALGIKVISVEPSVWKGRLALGSIKGKSVAKAEHLFGTKLKEGVAEAALIAYYVLKGHDTWS